MCGCDMKELRGNACHCSADGCHRDFKSVRTFDLHRKNGHCIDPATIGMELNKFGKWVVPMPEACKDHWDR